MLANGTVTDSRIAHLKGRHGISLHLAILLRASNHDVALL